MATVNQLKAEEKRYETLYTEAMSGLATAPDAAAKRDIQEAARPLAAQRWHHNKLAAARQYTFRLTHGRLELAGEWGVNTTEVTHDYDPDFTTADEAWTARDGENIEFFRRVGLPQSYDECAAGGDTTSALALYLEARDLVLNLSETIDEKARPASDEAWTVIQEQTRSGEARVFQHDLYSYSAHFADGQIIRFADMTYDTELGLMETVSR